jgi:hypothetical protein
VPVTHQPALGWRVVAFAAPVPQTAPHGDRRMKATAHDGDTDFRELTTSLQPQDPGDGTGLRFETGEHGGDYPDNMPQAITVIDAQGRWAV